MDDVAEAEGVAVETCLGFLDFSECLANDDQSPVSPTDRCFSATTPYSHTRLSSLDNQQCHVGADTETKRRRTMAAKHQKNWDGRERWLAETGWARADGCLHLAPSLLLKAFANASEIRYGIWGYCTNIAGAGWDCSWQTP
jgi:hypothetical protein